MLRHLIHLSGLVIAAVALTVLGCGKFSTDTPPSNPSASAGVQAGATTPDAIQVGNAAQHSPGASAPLRQARLEDLPPWPGAPLRDSNRVARIHSDDPPVLAERLHDPDPKVRMHALEAWAQHPGESLDPVTYALVDPDESVRARAQDLFEQELRRR